MHLGDLLNAQEARVALGYRLLRLLRFFRAQQPPWLHAARLPFLKLFSSPNIITMPNLVLLPLSAQLFSPHGLTIPPPHFNCFPFFPPPPPPTILTQVSQWAPRAIDRELLQLQYGEFRLYQCDCAQHQHRLITLIDNQVRIIIIIIIIIMIIIIVIIIF